MDDDLIIFDGETSDFDDVIYDSDSDSDRSHLTMPDSDMSVEDINTERVYTVETDLNNLDYDEDIDDQEVLSISSDSDLEEEQEDQDLMLLWIILYLHHLKTINELLHCIENDG